MKLVAFESSGCVLRQPDTSTSSAHPGEDTFLVANAAPHDNPKTEKYRFRGRLSHEQPADLKAPSQCIACQHFGHWSTDHEKHGSLKNAVLCSPHPFNSRQVFLHFCARVSNVCTSLEECSSFLQFVSAFFSYFAGNAVSIDSKPYGKSSQVLAPMAADGAPFSAVDTAELRVLMSIPPGTYIDFDPVPDSLIVLQRWGIMNLAHILLRNGPF